MPPTKLLVRELFLGRSYDVFNQKSASIPHRLPRLKLDAGKRERSRPWCTLTNQTPDSNVLAYSETYEGKRADLKEVAV